MGVWKDRKNSCERFFPVEFQPQQLPSSCQGFQELPSPPSSSSSSLPAPSGSPSPLWVIQPFFNLFFYFPKSSWKPQQSSSSSHPAPALWKSRILDFQKGIKTTPGTHPLLGPLTMPATTKGISIQPSTSQGAKRTTPLGFFFFPCLQPFQFFNQQLPHGFTLIPIYCRGEITQIQNDLTALLDSVPFQVFHETWKLSFPTHKDNNQIKQLLLLLLDHKSLALTKCY